MPKHAQFFIASRAKRFLLLLAACTAGWTSTSEALVIKNAGHQNYRFFDNALGPLNTAPPNPIFIGKDYDWSGVAVTAKNGTEPHHGGAMMISPHYFVTATHYYGATSYNFRNRDGVMITKATDGGRPMSSILSNGTAATSDLYIGKLAGEGITAADKISFYPVIMESTNSWNWYIGKEIFLYSMNGGNAVGINTISQVVDSGPPSFTGKSIHYVYSGAYTNQAGVNGESGSPWVIAHNGQLYAGGAHSAYFGTAAVNETYTSISSFIPAFADQIDAYMAEAHPGEKVTRVEVFNHAPTVTGWKNVTFQPGMTPEAVNLTFTDDNLPVNGVRTITATSSNQSVLPDSALVITGTGTSRTLVITPPPGINGRVTVSLNLSDGEKTATSTFLVTIIGTSAVSTFAASRDDSEQAANGTIALANSELSLGTDRIVGLRFPSVGVPRGAIITSASVQFTSGSPQNGPATFEIFLQDFGYASAFTATANDLSNRYKAATSVLWQPADWAVAGERGPAQRSPDLTRLIQRILGDIYWDFGHPIALFIHGSGQRNVEALDKIGGQPAQLTVTYSMPTTGTVSTFTIDSGLNDGEESADGILISDDSDLELVNDGAAGNQLVGLRFENISLPPGAILENAALQFAADEVSSGNASLLIRGEAVANSLRFSNYLHNLGSRQKTAASVSWTVSAWNASGEQGSAQLTPNIAPILNEVFTQSGWTNGNAISFFISGTGCRTADAFEDVAAKPAKLVLTYILEPHPHSYEKWSAGYPMLTVGQRQPDGDRFTNLMEFALALNANTPSASPIRSERAGDNCHFIYTRPRSTYGITYLVEWTDNLASPTWNSTGARHQVIAEDGTKQTMRTIIPTQGSPRRFARLRVTQGNPGSRSTGRIEA